MNSDPACPNCGQSIVRPPSLADACPACLATSLLEAEPPPEERPPEAASAPASARFGKYVRTRRLATGGMGEVWKAWDTALGRWVALKFMKEGDPELAGRFAREARTAAQLDHPGIAAVYDVGEDQGKRFIAMEFIEGTTLEAFPRGDRRLLVRLVRDAARAVGQAHEQGIVHRDLKPSNLMVDSPREESGAAGPRVVVTDFGLAKPVVRGPRLTSLGGTGAGTPAYMAPEQARGQETDARTDVYALGATLFELLTGKVPFPGDGVVEILRRVENEPPPSPRRLDRTIDADLETIALKCLEKEPGRRYAAAGAVADDLDRWLEGEPILARPSGPAYRAWKYVRRRWRPAVALGASLVAIASALALSLHRARRLEAWGRAYQQGLEEWDKALRFIADPARRPQALERIARARAGFEEANRVFERAEACVMLGRCLQLEGRGREAEQAWERALRLDPANGPARFDLAKRLLSTYRASRALIPISEDSTLRFIAPPRESSGQDAPRIRAEELLARSPAERAGNDLLNGLLAMGDGDYLRAAGFLSTYVVRESWDAEGMRLLALCRMYLGDFERAAAVLDDSLRLGDDAFGHLLRGLVHVGAGDLGRALISLDLSLACDPASAVAHNARGNVRRMSVGPAAAIEDFSRAIAIDPRYSKAYYNLGSARFALGDMDGALKEYARSIELDPRYALVFAGRGNVLYSRRDFQSAVADYSKAIDLAPELPIAYVGRANAKQQLDDLAGALADYNRAIEIHPRHAAAYAGRGGLRVKLRDLPGALADLNRALELDPGAALVHALRAQTRADAGDLDGAIADYRRALELDPKTDPAGLATALKRRGRFRKEEGDLHGSLEDLDRAIELRAADVEALRWRGGLRAELGDLDGAVDDLARASQWDPGGSRQPLFDLSLRRGDERVGRMLFDEAIADYARAIEIDPKSATPRLRRGLARVGRGDLPGAEEDLTSAIALSPAWAHAYDCRGYTRSLRGDLQGALEDLDRALELDPGSVRARLNRAHVHVARRDWSAAIGDYSRSIEVDPDSVAAHSGRGVARRHTGALEDALADFNRAIELEPRHVNSYIGRGSVWKDKRDYGSAILDFTKAIELDPSRPGSYDWRGLTRRHLGDLDGAIADHTRALELDSTYVLAYLNRALARKQKGEPAAALSDCEKALEIAPEKWPHRAELLRELEGLRKAKKP